MFTCWLGTMDGACGDRMFSRPRARCGRQQDYTATDMRQRQTIPKTCFHPMYLSDIRSYIRGLCDTCLCKRTYGRTPRCKPNGPNITFIASIYHFHPRPDKQLGEQFSLWTFVSLFCTNSSNRGFLLAQAIQSSALLCLQGACQLDPLVGAATCFLSMPSARDRLGWVNKLPMYEIRPIIYARNFHPLLATLLIINKSGGKNMIPCEGIAPGDMFMSMRNDQNVLFDSVFLAWICDATHTHAARWSNA